MILMAAKTAADVTIGFGITNDYQSIKVECIGLSGTEKAILEIKSEVNGTWVAAYMDGNAMYMDANSNVATIDVAGTWRINKPITANAVGVAVSSTTKIDYVL